MHAEDTYLFRHALLRDAAHQMQMPGDRAKLHELAFYLIEEAFGGRAPEPPPVPTENSVAAFNCGFSASAPLGSTSPIGAIRGGRSVQEVPLLVRRACSTVRVA